MKFLFLGIYALLLCAVAFFTRKKNKTSDDFLLGGRKTGAWMSAFAYGTTYFSAVIFVGYAGNLGWGIGISTVAIGLGNAFIGSFLAWKVLGKSTAEATRRLDASTMPEFFAKRFGSNGLKLFSAIIIFVFLVPYSASVYQGLSYLFESVFGVPFIYCILGMAVLTGIYLLFGGYLATAVTDFIQGIIMLFGVVLMVIFILKNPAVGGLANGLKQLAGIDPQLASIPTGQSLITLLSVVMLTSLGSWAMPQMVHKFYAIKDESALKRGTIISTIFALIVGVGAYLSGAFGRLFLANTMPVDAVTGLANADMIVPNMLIAALPDILLAIIVLLVLSASMSTLSSLVLVSSSAIAKDLVKGIFKPDMDDKRVMLLMRLLCVLFVALSVIFSLAQQQAILTLMSVSWGAIAGAFLGPFLYGVRGKKANAAGAWAGMAGGLATSILCLLLGLSAALGGCIAMVVSLIAVPLVSRLSAVQKVPAPAAAVATEPVKRP
ncbi:sodium/solute symporter [Eubacteriales bacterium OttesenSCG-928-N14]|nr:sodium/solute symporter [Eubacteriales bacterium OttesenSCG-928-N14]